MANITFSNPEYKNKTVYATAGSHTESVLKIAKENKIPIDFNCQDGECGTCLIKVTRLSDKGAMGGPLTEKEKAVLKGLNKITDAEIEKMLVDDLPTSWRLACQMIARDEDLLVEY
ncbi:MAG: 2Fe-2S iron-sulfur cluster-binding protein [Desulfobacterales bacterium]|jgi:ferredoxin